MNKLIYLIPISLFIAFSCSQETSSNLDKEIQAIENGLLPAWRIDSEPVETFNILDRMDLYNIPGASIAIVENGQIKWAKGYGIANTETNQPVDTSTLFQAGSISKPVAALGALKLVDEGKLDLDQDVNTYLIGWKVPENDFTNQEKVTLRRLLTHTAGMTVHGFPGYSQTDTFPSITQVLNGEGNTPRIYVDTIPGSIWRYSGGGYTVMEKAVEDVSSLSLDQYLDANILQPIGMTKSTYQQPLGQAYQSNASAAYNRTGEILEGLWHNYPEQAAAGLWTTPSDLARYCMEIQQISAGKINGVLSKATVDEMLTKHKNDWGLGPSLQWEGDSLLFRHGGKNEGFTNEMVAFANKGNAVIIMTNADNGGKLIGEVLRAVSVYYDWGISNQRVITVIDLPKDYLKDYLGQYKLDFQVPGIGDYLIEVSLRGDTLRVYDPNNGDTNLLTAMEESQYIDLVTGDRVAIRMEGNQPAVIFNDRFRFYKQ